jgi:hypothetical protein
VRLVVGRELAEAVKAVLDLVDDVAARGRVEAGEEVRPAAGVVGRFVSEK